MKVKDLLKIASNYDLESNVLLEVGGDGVYNLYICEDEEILPGDLIFCIDNE